VSCAGPSHVRACIMSPARAVTAAAALIAALSTGMNLAEAASRPRRHLAPVTTTGTLRTWVPSPTLKVRPAEPPVGPAVVTVKGGRNETVSFQVVLTATQGLTGLGVTLTKLIGPGGAEIPAANAQLYRVGFITVTTVSDRAGGLGEWPDPLYPIGADRIYGEPRNGEPFDLVAGRNQPIWVSLDIPKEALAGAYSGTFAVTQGPSASVLASVPITLTVWNFALPDTPSARTTYGFDTYATYTTHFCPGQGCWENDDIAALTLAYWREALAHRITLDGTVGGVNYTYDAGTDTITDVDWASYYDPLYSLPGVTSFPIPGPDLDWNDSSHTWTQAETAEAIVFWRAAAEHFRAMGWFDRAFLYTQDEPHENWPLNVVQSNVLFQADPGLRALVTSEFTADLATGHIGIWCPIVNTLDDSPGFVARYSAERAAGKKVWWYDSNSSGDSDNITWSRYGIWPDEFIDHQGPNQRVHSWLHWRYHLDGYLYYAVTECYARNSDVWTDNYCFGRNGDGTLFYPGTPSVIGGAHHIAVPSLRLELLRGSWNEFDYMTLLAAAGQGSFVDQVVGTVVTDASTFSHDPAAYDAARDELGSRLDAFAR